jgi:hypothetical protein
MLSLVFPSSGIEVEAVGVQDPKDKEVEAEVELELELEVDEDKVASKLDVIATPGVALAGLKFLVKIESISGTALSRRKVTQMSWQRGQQ